MTLDCGYLGGIDDDGACIPDFGGCYEALLKASGAELVYEDLKQPKTVSTDYQDDAINLPGILSCAMLLFVLGMASIMLIACNQYVCSNASEWGLVSLMGQ